MTVLKVKTPTGDWIPVASGGGGAVYRGPSTDSPSPSTYSEWIVTTDTGPWSVPLAQGTYSLRVSDGTTWFSIAGGGGGGVVGERPTAAFTTSIHWSEVTVNGSTSSDPDGYITSYLWIWGDGTPNSSGVNATHTYATSGTYNIQLFVTDNNDQNHSVINPVTVTAMYGPVIFTTMSNVFDPKIWLSVDSTNQIEWLSGTTGAVLGTGIAPHITFPSVAQRTVQMWCSKPQDVLTVNVGFDHTHDTGTYRPGISGGATPSTAYNHDSQHCRSVTGLQVLPNLVNFMGAGDVEDLTYPVADLLTGHMDFSGLSKLEFVECAYARVSSVNLTGCNSLIRLCLEMNNFQGGPLDLNPVRTTLRDLRAAYQGGLNFTPLVGPMASLYHFCVRAQPLVNMPTWDQFPTLIEHWIWTCSQSGTFTAGAGAGDLQIYQNSYNVIDLTHTNPIVGYGQLDASSNPITSILGLATGHRFFYVFFRNCNMNQTLVNQILADVNSWGLSGPDRAVRLPGNAAPTGGSSNADVVALRARGYTVEIA